MASRRTGAPKVSSEFAKLQLSATAVDLLLLRIVGSRLQVFLLQRTVEPCKNMYAVPGRFVRYDETLTQTADMVLKQKCETGTTQVSYEQLHTFGNDLWRDERIRTISVVYIAKILPTVECKATLGKWFAVDAVPNLAFDHNKLLDFAVVHLQKQIRLGVLPFEFLPSEFTLTQMQESVEAILQKSHDKRNFRKRILADGVLKKTSKRVVLGVARPAYLYSKK